LAAFVAPEWSNSRRGGPEAVINSSSTATNEQTGKSTSRYSNRPKQWPSMVLEPRRPPRTQLQEINRRDWQFFRAQLPKTFRNGASNRFLPASRAIPRSGGAGAGNILIAAAAVRGRRFVDDGAVPRPSTLNFNSTNYLHCNQILLALPLKSKIDFFSAVARSQTSSHSILGPYYCDFFDCQLKTIVAVPGHSRRTRRRLRKSVRIDANGTRVSHG
jgi:hypothetical protein